MNVWREFMDLNVIQHKEAKEMLNFIKSTKHRPQLGEVNGFGWR